MVTRMIKSAFGHHYIENDWKDIDWDNYQFNLKLRESICSKTIVKRRNLNRDEKKFIAELEAKNDVIRKKYKK